MAKRKPENSGGGAGWLATFGDLMNLLLCFFVLLFSMSTVDAQKYEKVVKSLQSTFSVLPEGGSAMLEEGILISSGASQLNDLSDYYNNMGLNTDGDYEEQEEKDAYEEVEQQGMAESEQMAENIENALESSGVSAQVDVSATSKYVLLSLNGGILYDSGKAELKDEGIQIIDKVSDALKQYDSNVISVEGHTDNVPINTSTYPNNMMLSLYRAYSVFDYFVNNKGFDPATISSSGRGDAVPVASNSTPEGRAQNRRVEIKIYNSFNK